MKRTKEIVNFKNITMYALEIEEEDDLHVRQFVRSKRK